MTEKEQFEFLVKIGFKMKDAIETIKKMTLEENDSHDNLPYLNENDKKVLTPAEDENALKTPSRASENVSENDLKKMLESMQTELREMRETIHAQNRKNAVIETANTQPKTVDENVEELLKSMEVN